jgi:hypothetical protein
MTPTRILRGNEVSRAMDKVNREQRRRREAPYEWLYPPPESIRVHVKGSIATPAASTETLVLSYQVPSNRRFYLSHLTQQYVGGNSSTILPGDGNISWNLTVNIPVGVTSWQGYYVQGFSESLAAGNGGFPLGNFQGGLNSPYPLVKPELVGPDNTLRLTVTVSATPAGGRIVGIFDGWLVQV